MEMKSFRYNSGCIHKALTKQFFLSNLLYATKTIFHYVQKINMLKIGVVQLVLREAKKTFIFLSYSEKVPMMIQRTI